MSRQSSASPLSAVQLVDEYFIENRNRLIEVAAFLDRIDRADVATASEDFRMQALSDAIAVLASSSRTRVRDIQMLMSDPSTEPLPALDRKGAVGAVDRSRTGGPVMRYIDHHAHMVSRTTDDYAAMALTGCVAVTEPAFWAGWDCSTPEGFEDYFRQLMDFEPRRAAQHHIQHYTWLGMNPKESDDRKISVEVLRRLPRYLDGPTVIGIGEIGLNRVTRNEIATYTEQVELATQFRQLVLIHTPHLEDKHKGTRVTLDVLRRYPDLAPGRVLVDHAEEHTIEAILADGYWAGLTLYPQTKVSAQRAVDMIEMYGPDRILVAGACDWGPSEPLAVPKFIAEMRRRRHTEELIHRVVFENPVRFLRQSPKFQLPAGLEASMTSPVG